jgi:nitroimidazol reductase NimA-like FMN-containing flavoprotein (pyridoxamine 5'-phosphate oxidase superfamily)
MKDVTLYSLCGEDHYVFARMNDDGEVTVEVQDENDNVVYQEKSNRAAWESLVSFAKMVIRQDGGLDK